MMTKIPDSARDFLAPGLLGHVVTLNADGTPHVTLTWAGFEGDALVPGARAGRAEPEAARASSQRQARRAKDAEAQIRSGGKSLASSGA